MMIILEVKLPDIPGSLIELIRPISENSGNIYGILHYHDRKVNNMIPVTINFELTEEIREVSLTNIKRILNKKNIQIDTITFDTEKRTIMVILSGHVFDTDILDTIKRLGAKKIKVLELYAKFTELEEISNVKLKLEFPETMAKSVLLAELSRICKEKNLFLISS
ncbi:MAG: hypothetical protein WBH31_13125 [Promethearchaeia archaeon]